MIDGDRGIVVPKEADVKIEDEREHPQTPITSNTQRTHAVIHMGVHKTGTTSVQTLSARKKNLLKLDGYDMPWLDYKERRQRGNEESMKMHPNENHLYQNQVNFATCFVSPVDVERKVYPCNPDLLLHGLDIAERKRNLFVSAETFSKIDGEGVDMLASYLSHWDDATIIIYYRRYYSWIVSVYNQVTKSRKFGDKTANNIDKWEKSILEFIVEQCINDTESGFTLLNQYTTTVFEKVKRRFDNVVVLDYHNENVRGSEESLFCDAMQNMTHTCNSIRTNKNTVITNQKVDLIHGDLAYGAIKAGLLINSSINSDKQMKMVTEAVKNHQEKTLKLKSSDFERICPPPEIIEKIWQISSNAEAMLFPERNGSDGVNSTSASSDMRSDFDEVARTALCKLDVEKTLRKKEWDSFFKKLEV